jgi:hypothetical protein
MQARVAPRLVLHQPGPSSLALCGAVVETVSVVEPLFVIDAGLKLQVLSRGNPEHDVAVKMIVPLNPGWPVTLSMTLPLLPGLAMVMVGAAAAKPKSACTVTVVADEMDPT